MEKVLSTNNPVNDSSKWNVSFDIVEKSADTIEVVDDMEEYDNIADVANHINIAGDWLEMDQDAQWKLLILSVVVDTPELGDKTGLELNLNLNISWNIIFCSW